MSIQKTFTLGTEVTFNSLTIVPLLGTSSSAPDYDTLDAALARGTLQITEVTESGSVPEIKVLNTGQRPVLIIDGEELVGAKQNRTVNISILIPPAADVIVPVTCVETGRWNRQSRGFASSSRTHYAAGRAAKSAQVSESLRREGVARERWRRCWRITARQSSRSSVDSLSLRARLARCSMPRARRSRRRASENQGGSCAAGLWRRAHGQRQSGAPVCLRA